MLYTVPSVDQIKDVMAKDLQRNIKQEKIIGI